MTLSSLLLVDSLQLTYVILVTCKKAKKFYQNIHINSCHLTRRISVNPNQGNRQQGHYQLLPLKKSSFLPFRVGLSAKQRNYQQYKSSNQGNINAISKYKSSSFAKYLQFRDEFITVVSIS